MELYGFLAAVLVLIMVVIPALLVVYLIYNIVQYIRWYIIYIRRDNYIKRHCK